MRFYNMVQDEVLWSESGLLGRKASVSDYVARLESRPSFSLQAPTLKRPLSACKQTTAISFPDSSPVKSHLQLSITENVFSRPFAKETFVFLIKGKNVPTEHGELLSLTSFQTCIVFPQPILTFFGWIKWTFSPSQLSPSFLCGYLYLEYLYFLIHWTTRSLILKGHFQVILPRKLSWGRWLQADSFPLVFLCSIRHKVKQGNVLSFWKMPRNC